MRRSDRCGSHQRGLAVAFAADTRSTGKSGTVLDRPELSPVWAGLHPKDPESPSKGYEAGVFRIVCLCTPLGEERRLGTMHSFAFRCKRTMGRRAGPGAAPHDAFVTHQAAFPRGKAMMRASPFRASRTLKNQPVGSWPSSTQQGRSVLGIPSDSQLPSGAFARMERS